MKGRQHQIQITQSQWWLCLPRTVTNKNLCSQLEATRITIIPSSSLFLVTVGQRLQRGKGINQSIHVTKKHQIFPSLSPRNPSSWPHTWMLEHPLQAQRIPSPKKVDERSPNEETTFSNLDSGDSGNDLHDY